MDRKGKIKHAAPKKPQRTAEQYEELARQNFQKMLPFEMKARGRDDVFRGVLLACIPMGKVLAEATAKVADPTLLQGFPGAEDRRRRAQVAVMRTNDPETGEVRFFTPRVQQVRWPI